MNRKKWMALGISAILMFQATACGTNKTEEVTEDTGVRVDVQTPGTDIVESESAFMGTVSPGQQVYVIPFVAGTVTEVNYAVGDTVSEGDVLFRIDDAAGQLQLKSANATYNAAAAGAKAATGGARELQNYQTEQGIDTLQDSLDTLNDTLDNLGKQWDTVYDQINTLKSQLAAAQTGRDQAKTAYDQAVAAAGGTYEQLVNEKTMLQTELETLKNTGSAIDTDPSTSGTPGNTYEVTYQNLTSRIAAIDAQLAPISTLKNTYDQAVEAVNSLQAGISELESAKAQIETGYDTAEASRDSVKKNLETTEGTYSITKNKVYPQTDATYKAQLSQAAVAIDSANYQLDMYTITAPISGVVDSVSVEVDSLASQSSPAFIISNKDTMSVTFYVAEAARNALSAGDTIRVERNGIEAEGTITEVGTMANQQTKTFQVKASINAPEEQFANGVSVKVYAVTDCEQNKLSVPYDALTFSAGNAYLYVVENDEIVKKMVTVGLMNSDSAVIEEGVDEDTYVITNWSDKLRNHAKAQIVTINGEAYGAENGAGSDAGADADTDPGADAGSEQSDKEE